MESAPTLSFGVISFYSAQVRLILQELERPGIALRDDDGTLEIAPRWRETTDDRGRRIERLRVGTVDAFQGRQFDVVLLSLTRSSAPAKGDEQAALRRRYGHLMLENRLCVAMSRQQRLLVAVGDADMVVSEAGARAVPALRSFLDLCRGEHGAYRA